jgi:N-methylhydantoinase B
MRGWLRSYTTERLRRRVATLPIGKHSFTTWLDDDGSGGAPVPIVATVTIGGDTLHIDLEGTGPQAQGAFNVCPNALRATVYYCVKALLDPDLVANSGMFTAVAISAPKGPIANPNFPAACGARSITCQKIAGAVFGAFRDVLPVERQIASSNDILPSTSFSGSQPDTGRFYVCGEALGGGSGARSDSDGMDAIHVHVTNSLNLPAEAMENKFPLLCEEYGLVVDSGGAGRQRGGLGIARQVRALQDGTIFSALSDSHIHGAEGIGGGGTGGLSSLIRNPGREDQDVLPSKVAYVVLKAGESLRIETPGGAGFGPCNGRLLESIACDLWDGVITRPAAERDYGAQRVQAALQASGAASPNASLGFALRKGSDDAQDRVWDVGPYADLARVDRWYGRRWPRHGECLVLPRACAEQPPANLRLVDIPAKPAAVRAFRRRCANRQGAHASRPADIRHRRQGSSRTG